MNDYTPSPEQDFLEAIQSLTLAILELTAELKISNDLKESEYEDDIPRPL